MVPNQLILSPPMLVTINGQRQTSFEQFEETFRQVFGREMTRSELEWLRPADFVDNSFSPADLKNDGAPDSALRL